MEEQTWLPPVALALAAVGLLLLVALTLCCLRKRMMSARSSYHELIHTTPTVPACTAPLALASQEALATPRQIPFMLPPRLSTMAPFKRSEETCVEPEETHRGSLCVSSWFPVGSLLSTLYPSSPSALLGTAPPAVLGPQICFSVQYRPRSEQLLVSLLGLSNLPPPLQPRLAVIELQLLPDDRRPLQAKARNTGPHPDFNHCLVFQVSPLMVPASVLVLVLLSVGADRRRPVGRVEVPLRGDLCYTGRVQWRALQSPHNSQSWERGELLVSLSYSPSVQRLNVEVTRARGLQIHNTHSALQVQVSLQSPSQLKSKRGPLLKTESRPGPDLQTESRPGPDPQTEFRPGPVQSEEDLNQTYCFKLKKTQLDQSCVRIQVLQDYRGTGMSTQGALVLGPLMFARGPQLDHWMEMLAAPGGAVERWHSLGPAPL